MEQPNTAEPELAPVVAFPEKIVEGTARCAHCQHLWDASVVASKRFDPLDCPKCSHRKGLLLLNAHLPGVSFQVWICDCGNDMLYFARNKVDGRLMLLCPNCGAQANAPKAEDCQ